MIDEMIYDSKCFFANDELLNNPHMGFSTFQRFNGDKLNDLGLNNGGGWTEGYPIEYQEWDGKTLTNINHPDTTVAYWRVYWRFLVPERGVYRWDMFDKALQTARERKQTLMLRIAPYGGGADQDVPDWYRKIVGFEGSIQENWRTDPENPLYAETFGEFIKAIAERYDGHPDLDSVDLAFIGYWGEGAGCEKLSDKTLYALTDAYINNFTKTPLMSLMMDRRHHEYCRIKSGKTGWRADCLGDVGGFSPNWSHMYSIYPELIYENNITDSWKTGPVSFEVCWVVNKWYQSGWDIDYIIDQSLKWHISTFNPKSSPIPEEWQPNVERWLKKMGYRFVIRRARYNSQIKQGGILNIKSWWENLGVAPIYYRYPVSFRLKGENNNDHVFKSDVDITTWLPGDIIFTEKFELPPAVTAGNYMLQAAITGRFDFDSENIPAIKLANDGRNPDGWHDIGAIIVE